LARRFALASEPDVKTLTLTLLAVASAQSVLACDLCSIYSANQAHGETGPGWLAGLSEQFTHFGTMQMDGHKVENEVGQRLESSVTQVFAGYNFNERFGLQFNLPIIYRSFKRPEGFEIDRGTESGIGDVALLGSFSILRNESKNGTFAWHVMGGIKLPTGSTDRLHEEVDELTEPPPPPGAPESGIHGHDLTLGSGSVDGIAGTSIYFRHKRLFFAASTQYSIRTEGDFDYRFANDLTWLGGPGYYLVLNEHWTFTLQLNVSGEYKETDTFRENKAEDTGVTAVYLGPEISVTWGDKLSAELGGELPVSIDNTSLQLVPDYRIRAGLTWRF